MKRKNCLAYAIVLLLPYFLITSTYSQQINDNFDNGAITGWTQGTNGHWTSSTTSPINGSHSLKHNLSNTAGKSYISKSISSLDLTTQDITWQFNLKNGNWDPSGSNKFWIYLTANEFNLKSSTVDGYAIGVNLTGTSDILTLWKVTNGTADTSIITTTIDWDANKIKGIKVTRSTNGLWKLFIDENGGFDSLDFKGSVTNNDYIIKNYFGIYFQYTKSRAGLLWIDDILVEGKTPSTNPTVSFKTSTSSINETNTTFNKQIPLSFSNYTSNATINITIDSNSTAEATDYSLNTSSLIFTSNGTKNISLDINNDLDMDNETIILKLTITNGVADINISTYTLVIIDDDLPKIIINEILADPTGIDANGDGTISTSQDEFIELVNTDITPHILTDYTISDNSSIRHTFGNITIPAGGSVVIFGGGAPTNISGISLAASTGRISLNNTGDTVTLKNNNGVIITTYTYGSEANADQSIGRNDDLTGNFVKHSLITSNPQKATPGKYNTTDLPFSTITWKGAVDSNWNTSSNWSTDKIPSTSDEVLILKTTNQPTVNSSTSIKKVTLASGASLIANAHLNGDITYRRSLATNNWYLVASPLKSETIENLIAYNDFATGPNKNIGIAPYKNDGSAWNYLSNNSTGVITSGKGYSVKLNVPSDLKFTGEINTGTITYPITQATNNFNLIGNPFTSYINLSTFFTDNSTALSEETIWLWNQATNSYDLKMGGIDGSFQISPTQGFFVSANRNTNITFSKTNQSHQSDTFQRNTKTEINVTVTENKNTKSTKLFYLNEATTGFDNGYDGTMFNGISSSFAIYSQLVSNNKGKNFAIQSLPINNLETIIVPIGLKFDAGKTIEFSAKSINLPSNIQVYLEDRIHNTFTNLSKENYTSTLKNNVDGIGQFYIHTTSQKLSSSNNNQILENVSTYQSSKNEITITGLQSDKASLSLYTILGKKIIEKKFKSNGKIIIGIPKITSGIYLIKITSKNGSINKKIHVN
ncbi:lamin tail domain-containing protein [uncultured Tenacibaculum sp.]|uniref:lamin tail domain-containing protein n=1 Tax=uncultured Tenacibaculum sp. TaxID=174713 RepID=UPI0026244A48|nr:lamin tail domain-containing protein [uncultured Tenacibaculum sp.]